MSPTALRRRRQYAGEDDVVVLNLGYRPPLAWPALVQFLSSRGTPRSEMPDNDRYLRTVRIGDCRGWIAASPHTSSRTSSHSRKNLLRIEIAPALLPVLTPLRVRLRRLFDLDANPALIEAHLCCDERLASHIRATPGLRIGGTMDGFELALRTVLGQQISVKAATTIFGRFTDFFGAAVETPFAGLDRLAPMAADIAGAHRQQIIDRGLTRKRAETVHALARAVADKTLTLEPAAGRDTTRATLAEIPGIGPWTIQYIAMRALADPNAFPASDLALLKALKMKRAAQLEAAAEPWRPWRAYAAMHLWHRMAAGG